MRGEDEAGNLASLLAPFPFVTALGPSRVGSFVVKYSSGGRIAMVNALADNSRTGELMKKLEVLGDQLFAEWSFGSLLP